MLNRLTSYCTVLLILAALYLAPGSIDAQGDGWRVELPVLLSDLLADRLPMPHLAMIAPDGRQVAYETEGIDDETRLCVFDIPQQQERCIGLPREYRFSAASLLPAMRWSSDSSAIATVGAPYLFFLDTDLGVVDLTTPELTYTKLEEDDFDGNFAFAREPLPSDVTIPSYPAFSPDSTQIAFERAVVAPEDGMVGPAWISIIDAATGEVRDLTRLPGQEIYERDMGSIVGMDWSPDGTTLAVSLRHAGLEPEYDGIWLVDVETSELTPLLTVADLETLAQETYGDEGVLIAAAPILWSPDGARLLFWLGYPGAPKLVEWIYWIDVVSGEVTPAPLSALPSDTTNFPGSWPLQAVWSPDGSMIMVAARLPEPPADPLPLAEGEGDLITALYLIDVASGELTLLGHLPLAPTSQFTAAWGPDNDVLAGGYAFKLVPG